MGDIYDCHIVSSYYFFLSHKEKHKKMLLSSATNHPTYVRFLSPAKLTLNYGEQGFQEGRNQ